MFAVERPQSLLYCFYICALVNEVLNFFGVDRMPLTHFYYLSLSMDTLEVEGMNMVEEQDHMMNHRLGEDDMKKVDSHMVEVEDTDTVDVHYQPMNHRSEVYGTDREDSGMVEVVEREPDGVVLMRHWTGDRAVRHR
jgi:hypothetical protein